MKTLCKRNTPFFPGKTSHLKPEDISIARTGAAGQTPVMNMQQVLSIVTGVMSTTLVRILAYPIQYLNLKSRENDI